MIRVRIAGAICRIRIEPEDFEGWGVFQPVSHTEAMLVRETTLAERRRYLQLFPTVRQIVTRRTGRVWYGAAASAGDARIAMEGLAPVHLVEEVQLFDRVRTRYDGVRFWFDELDLRHDPAASAYLRSALQNRTEPGKLDRRGLTAEERASYELYYWQLVRGETKTAPRSGQASRQQGAGESANRPIVDPVLCRLRGSLSHAGGQLVDYLERADSFRVRFTVGGRDYNSSVDKADLTVQVAGICLGGEDSKFDLSSLVGVLREGQVGGDIVPVGGDNDGMGEAEYWRVHPPRN